MLSFVAGQSVVNVNKVQLCWLLRIVGPFPLKDSFQKHLCEIDSKDINLFSSFYLIAYDAENMKIYNIGPNGGTLPFLRDSA